MVEGMSVVMNLMSVMSPPPTCMHGGEFMYFGCVCFRVSLAFCSVMISACVS